MSKESREDLREKFVKKLSGGGDYAHLDQIAHEISDTQMDVLRDLLVLYPAKTFVQDSIDIMVKNTHNIICNNCGSENVYVESKQLRSADEATTKIYTCIDCGNTWRIG